MAGGRAVSGGTRDEARSWGQGVRNPSVPFPSRLCRPAGSPGVRQHSRFHRQGNKPCLASWQNVPCRVPCPCPAFSLHPQIARTWEKPFVRTTGVLQVLYNSHVSSSLLRLEKNPVPSSSPLDRKAGWNELEKQRGFAMR